MPDEPSNGGTLAYRVGQAERVAERTAAELEAIRRDVDRMMIRSETACQEQAKLEARQGATERQLTDLRIEFAKWAAAGGLAGGLLSQIIAYILQNV